MSVQLCAWCLLSADNAASLLTYIDSADGRQELIRERGAHFGELLARIKAGEHPDISPEAVFHINQIRTNAEAVTMLHGTAVCAAHVFDLQDAWLRLNPRALW